MMAADTAQEIITTPVVPPTGSTGTVTKSAVCPDAPVENASSCAGFLPGALPKATCTYSQFTQENNDAPVTTLMDCTCATTDLLWSCAEPVVVPSKADEETTVDDVDVGTDVSDLATDEATAAVTAATDAAAGTIATVTDAAATVTDAAATVTDAAAAVTDVAAGTIAGATDALNDSEVSDIADVDVTGCDGLNGVLPQDGEDCKQYMPDGKSTLGCGGESYSGTTKTAATCICDPSKAVTPEAATWTCSTSDSQIEQKPCPGQDDPKATGESCEGLLSEPDSLQKCMWSRRTSMDVDVESFWCTCANTGESANVWDCDGAFAPVSASTADDDGMMAADTPQEIITTPVVPPAGSTGTGTMSECPATQVQTGDSCA